MRTFVAFAICAAACKRAPVDDRPIVDDDELRREVARAERGENVGEPLRSPRVVVDAAEITVNGHHAASRSDVTGASGKIRPLETWMLGLHDHWKRIHAGQDFSSRANLIVPADLSYVEGASLVHTLAASYYADNLAITCGDASVTLQVLGPQPPHDERETRPPPIFVVLSASSSGWSARLSVEAPFGSPYVAPAKMKCQAPKPATIDSARAAARDVCGGACQGLYVTGAERFVDAVRVLANALPAAIGGAKVVLFPYDPCE
jgi:hypothetical protein